MNRPTKEQLLHAKNTALPDVIDYHLRILFCGINPGLYTAATGYHFARPGNRFWPTLYTAGYTDTLYSPDEQTKLLGYGYGITNIVARATNLASEITKEEFIAGGKLLEDKVIRYTPEWVAFIGIGAYKAAFNRNHADIGLQKHTIGNTRIWLLPSTSGLNAHYTPTHLTELFRRLLIAVNTE
jgi:double-stranded uracil-DNA glycosylase